MLQHLSCRHRELLDRYDIRLVEVPWALPPTLSWYPKYWWPGKPDGWCGPMDLVRLHVLGMEEYDAAAFYDQDIEFQGDVTPMMRCAATGRFLSTSGGVGEPLNVGFFASRPDKRLLRAAELFAENITFNDRTGWGGSGFKPSNGRFVGAECGQGFFHTLFYQKHSHKAQQALAAAGVTVKAAQLDLCIWNYQGGSTCPPDFDCSLVRAHHKPTREPQGNDCGKLAFKRGRGRPTTPAPPPRTPRHRPGLALPCSVQCVHVGEHCRCNGNSVKMISVKGSVQTCAATTANPSGDTFSVSFAGSTITVARKHGCWCDGAVYVECCIAGI